MAGPQGQLITAPFRWICTRCRTRRGPLQSQQPSSTLRYSTTSVRAAEMQIQAAPEIDLETSLHSPPARIVPASPSYFTATPKFNDDFLNIQNIVKRNGLLPCVPPEQAPKIAWLKLKQYRTHIGETVPASKYAKILAFLTRLNRINPQLRPIGVTIILEKFRRPGSEEPPKAKPGKIDTYGRSVGVGRRKESSARAYLVEGTGEVIVNGKSLVEIFPRLHDRESALWALKTTERMDKYNVYALARGGGKTGQAESITLAVTKALLVHEPALKPALRRAGCVTRDPRQVERKKPGKLKARKMPAWVKR